MKHSKNQIKSGLIWSAIDSFGNQVLGLGISLTLANQIGPSAYGLVAMLTIFIAIAGVFVNSGFNSALIRKIDRNERDFATTFYFSLAMSILCYVLLFVASPYIASFYGHPELKLLTKIIAIAIVIDTLAIIPRTKISVSLDFKSQAKANLAALFLGGSVALYMAFDDFGVWALVGQQLTRAVVSVTILNMLSPWRPKEAFCKKSFKELFGFGSKLLASGLIDTVYNNLYGLIIGKQFSAIDLGLFSQARTLSQLPASTLTGIIQKVNYPVMSQIQNDDEKLEQAYLRTLKFSVLIIFPIMAILAISAQPLIILLLGEEWSQSGLYMSILCCGFILYPLQVINLNLLQVKGRSDLFLRLEVIKKINLTIMLMITVPMGITEMCIGMVVTSYLAYLINTYYSGRLTSIGFKVQVTALLPIFLVGFTSAFIASLASQCLTSNLDEVIMMTITTLALYMLLMTIFNKALIKEARLLILRGK